MFFLGVLLPLVRVELMYTDSLTPIRDLQFNSAYECFSKFLLVKEVTRQEYHSLLGHYLAMGKDRTIARFYVLNLTSRVGT